MSLRAFHLLFIVLSALLCCGVAAWCLDGHRFSAAAALALAGALVAYARRFMKKSRGLTSA